MQEAVERGVATPVISAALYARFVSQQEDSIAMKAIAALRNQFGGHAVLPETEAVDRDAGACRRRPVVVADVAGRPASDALVLFGATGDLARKKIFPAVYAMQRIWPGRHDDHRRGVVRPERRRPPPARPRRRGRECGRRLRQRAWDDSPRG